MGNDILNILNEIESLKKNQGQIQMGTVEKLDIRALQDTIAKNTDIDRKAEFREEIKFQTSFRKEPEIHIGLSFIDANTQKHHLRINIMAENITKDGFTFRIGTWRRSKIYAFRADWIAILSNS